MPVVDDEDVKFICQLNPGSIDEPIIISSDEDVCDFNYEQSTSHRKSIEKVYSSFYVYYKRFTLNVPYRRDKTVSVALYSPSYDDSEFFLLASVYLVWTKVDVTLNFFENQTCSK